LDRLFESLGGSLIASLESGGLGSEFPDFPQPTKEKESPRKIWEEKLRLNKEIVDTEGTIKAIEADLSRLGELEGEISRKESENIEKTKEASLVYTELGRLILDEPDFDKFTVLYRKQLEDIFLQIDSHEKRLNELENSEGNFIARLANGARGWLTKSNLAKNETALKGLYRSAGEQFILSRTQRDPAALANSPEIFDESSWENEISIQVQKAEEIQKLQASLKNDISRLLNERREIANTLNQEGNPVRRISGLEKSIARNRDEIRIVRRRFGFCIREQDWKDSFISLYSEDDKILEEKIKSLEDSLKETENRIEATKIAIAIDNEKAEIEKAKITIRDRQRRIAEAEAAIAEMEEQIAASEKRIQELSG
jgi:chromosome segregation ATPase